MEKSSSQGSKAGAGLSGYITGGGRFALYSFIKPLVSAVEMSDEDVLSLMRLACDGTVIYALKHKSRLNSLILHGLTGRKGLPQPEYCHGINMSIWQPFVSAVRVLKSWLPPWRKRRDDAEGLEYLASRTKERKSSLIHLGSSEFFENPLVQKTLVTLLKVQGSLSFPVYIVPVLINYGRRRLKEDENLLNILFGQEEHTGPVRRVISFLRYADEATVILGEAVKLDEFLENNRIFTHEESSDNLRRDLLDRIDEEKAAIVGPVLKSREEIINVTLRDEVFEKQMRKIAEEGKKPYESVHKEARKHLHEIAAGYNDALIEIWARFLSWLWNNIYDGLVVDREGLAKIRNLSKRMPFVIIPCHRSHIDYLVLSYVFYKHNIQLPFVAAGENLSFWPIGYLFRKSGAFFIRRTFRGDALYGEALAKYIKTLLKEGLPLEFFIEGGRSRTGKMVVPKYGFLSMILQAYQEKACPDLAAVPVFIGYDKVVEEKAYLDELGGMAKEREKPSDVIKSSRILKKRWGSVYLNVGEPILLKSYLALQDKPLDQMITSERQSLYRKLGYDIVLAINKVSLVTPFSLVSTGLLSHDRRGISHNDLMEAVNSFIDYLSFRKVRFSATFSNRQGALEGALQLFDQAGIISRIGVEEEDEEIDEIVYSLEDEKRLNLEYYKNNILHFFLPVSFVAMSILSSREDQILLSQIIEDYRFLKVLFRHEFIFDDQIDDLEEVNSILSYLHKGGLVLAHERGGEIGIEVRGMGRARLLSFAGLIHNYLESYWVVIRGCGYLKKGPRQEKLLLKSFSRLGEKIYRKGEIERAEALSQSNYTNAIKFLKDLGMITITDETAKGEKGKSAVIALADGKALDSLRRRLFRFL